MMTQAQLVALKKDIIARMVAEVPDEALGELIFTMRELLDHYGTNAAKIASESEAPTVANRDAFRAQLQQKQAATKRVDKPANLQPATSPAVAAKRAALKQPAANTVPSGSSTRSKANSNASSGDMTDKPLTIANRTSLLQRLQAVKEKTSAETVPASNQG